MKKFIDLMNENEIVQLEQMLITAETPEDVARLNKRISELKKKENKQYK